MKDKLVLLLCFVLLPLAGMAETREGEGNEFKPLPQGGFKGTMSKPRYDFRGTGTPNKRYLTDELEKYAKPVKGDPGIMGLPQWDPTLFYESFTSDTTCAAKESDFITLARAFETQSCYRKGDVLNSDDKIANIHALQSESSVCQCLRTKAKTNQALGNVLNTDFSGLEIFKNNKESREARLSTLQQNTRERVNKIKVQRLALSFDATIVFPGSKDGALIFRNEFAERLLSEPPQDKNKSKEKSDTSSWGQVSSQAADGNVDLTTAVAPHMLSKRKMSSDLVDATNKVIREELAKGSPKDAKMFDDSNMESNQCVGGREFLAFNQLPDDDYVLSELAKPGFKPDEWNYDYLKAKYDQMMFLTDKWKYKAEILTLKSKLLYLNKNPMIKTFLSIKEHSSFDAIFNLNFYTEEQKKELKKLDNPEKINQYKQQLFSILRDYAKNCDFEKEDCRSKAIQAGKLHELKEKMRAFFSKPEVGELSLLQANNGLTEDVKDIFSDKNAESNKKNYSHKAIMTRFVKENGGLNPNECTPSTTDVSKCAQIYSAFCPKIDDALAHMGSDDSDPELEDNLDVLSSNDLNPDIKENEELQNFNREICETPHKKNDLDPKERALNFFEYQNEQCKGQTMQDCRSRYITEYHLDEKSQNFNKFLKTSPVKSVEDAADVTKIAKDPGKKSSLSREKWENFRQSLNISPESGSFGELVKDKVEMAKASLMAPLAKGAESAAAATKEIVEPGFTTDMMNYSRSMSAAPIAASVPQVAEPQKVENMTEAQKQDLLDGWKKEYDNWKKSKSGEQSAAADGGSQSILKQRIEALESLLAQQKQLTQEQYRMLNEGLALKKKGEVEETVATETSSKRRPGTMFEADAAEVDDTVMRGPASVDSQASYNTSGSGGGSSSASFGRVSGSSAAAADSSNDSVDREQAKLVQFRENSNGSITIESAGSESTSSANAITVPVSDELYRMAQSNSGGFNLNQIEQMIPKDQIAKLESKGDYFVLLLQNGKNPPLEVKVKKQKSGLVKLANTHIVQRKVSLNSLRSTLKN